MFPEKFTFENLQHRTAKVSPLFQFIYQTNNVLRAKKNKGKLDKICLPIMAPEAVFFSKNLLNDLLRISKIDKDYL
ncbi:hypothetical protein N9R54_04755 [Pelobium sp.]|nr:hypothetical protein [Pelobium sp.]MDA9555526.1 hypothetical protein [Pelobium sp.]